MEPLSALSVATAVVQFVDFSANLFSTSKEIFKSPREVTKNSSSTAEIYASLKDLSERLITLTGTDDDDDGDSEKSNHGDVASGTDGVPGAKRFLNDKHLHA